ncbi:type I pullulanase [Peribacillus sp. FSL H8-0477]|uniref:type I pullulanase n=1 Tax=Peribacillus sp. FSL H8-0477 TaxID=2921388 RepID=UPI0030F80089
MFKRKVISWVTVVSLLVSILLVSFVQPIAEASSTTKITIHYQEEKGNTKDWSLWVWPEGGEGKAYSFTGKDAFGKTAEIELPVDTKKVGFIIRTESWEKDGENDRWLDVQNGEGEVWVKSGDEMTYSEPPDGEYRDFPAYEKVKIKIHYFRYDKQYDGWNLWMWPDGKDGQAVQFKEEDEFGKVAEVELTDLEGIKKAGFIMRQSKDGNDWANKEFNERFITKFKEDGSAEIWLTQGVERVFYDPAQIDRSPKIVKSTIDKLNEITLETNFPFSLDEETNAGITLNGADIKEVLPYAGKENVTNKVRIVTTKNLDLSKNYQVTKKLFGTASVDMGAAIRTEAFDKLYAYTGTLGNIYQKKKTTFKLWAPTAAEAKLVTYKSWNDSEGKEIIMKRGDKGVWSTELKGNQDGLIYTYKVKIGDKWNEAVDPYVRAVTVNGDKGVVTDLSSTNPKKWNNKKPKSAKAEDAIFYELHIRDLSIQAESGIKQKGKYLGVAESKTTGPKGVKTGLNHIKDLGVTHVQFLPMYDYRTVDETKLNEPQYNWGYDPKNFNAPEGSYSTDPYKPKVRINEMKQMIQAVHNQDLRVVMDVVYNHMYAVNESNFNQLVPGYYFRYNEDGTLANGSGVGNDTASERKMMRKFIVDSVSYWAKEYHLDGFRFDLMGIHDVQTMNDVRRALDKIDPSIMVIGEGWDLNTPLAANRKANQKNAEQMPRIAHFNDSIRDGLKGSVFNELDTGFVNGKQGMEDIIKKGIAGGINYDNSLATYKDPQQVVTYVEAHDNHTLWDKLALTNPKDSLTKRKQMHKLASSISLTSQGINFIHAGQEFMRTKGGDHNSYKSPDAVNQLDWKRRAEFTKEVEYMKGLIKLRKQYSGFRLATAKEIEKNVQFFDAPKNVIAYRVTNPEKAQAKKQLIVIHNANNKDVKITLPKKGTWSILVNGQKAGTKELGKIKTTQVTVPALSSYVLVGNK